MKLLCSWYGITAQAHYQHMKRLERRRIEEEQIRDQVLGLRRRHRRMGTRKLLAELRPVLARKGVRVGRDRLFELLGRHQLLIRPKRRYRRTTIAGRWRCQNLLEKQLRISAANQAWVSDITYLDSEKGFLYLSLVTDLYSRCIIGYQVSQSLAVEGTLAAIRRACKEAQTTDGVIHHSDRGVQYTCSAYRNYLHKQGIQSSMGARGDCYDNAVAERINGILKLEYGLDARFKDLADAKRSVREAIWLYNHERPHLSLGYKKPAQLYYQSTQ